MHTGGTSPGFIYPVQHNGTAFCISIQRVLIFVQVFCDVLKSQNIHLSKNHLFLKAVIFLCSKYKGLFFSLLISIIFTIEPAGICGLTLKMVNTSSATVKWNPTKTNFTSYNASLSNNTFIKKFTIPGTVTDFSVTDLTAGGTYNFTLKRLKGNIEGASAFLEFVSGLYGFLLALPVNGSFPYQCMFICVHLSLQNNLKISRDLPCNSLLSLCTLLYPIQPARSDTCQKHNVFSCAAFLFTVFSISDLFRVTHKLNFSLQLFQQFLLLFFFNNE